MHVKTVIFSEKSLTFALRYCNFSERYMMTSPLHFYLSLNAFSPTFWISCQPLWSPSQCFFGAQMTVLRSTFKDNCLIGVFSYAVGSRGPEKGSDNSVIMRLQQIFTFVAKLWRMSWQSHALSTSTFPLWTLRCSEKKKLQGIYQCKCTSIFVRTHGCISVYEWDVWGCLNLAGLQVSMGKFFGSAFIPCALPLSPLWKVGEHNHTVHLLPPSAALGYKVSDEVYLCKMLWGGASHAWRQLSPEPFSKGFAVNMTSPVESRRDVLRWGGSRLRGKYSYGLR